MYVLNTVFVDPKVSEYNYIKNQESTEQTFQ
jgi:hypothetical protein